MSVNSLSLSGHKGIGMCPDAGSVNANRAGPSIAGFRRFAVQGKNTECLLGSDTGKCHFMSFTPMAICLSVRSGIVRQAFPA
jgi:hypothetical protein